MSQCMKDGEKTSVSSASWTGPSAEKSVTITSASSFQQNRGGPMVGVSRVVRTLFVLSFVVIAPFAFAQQTGSITGRVTATDGSALPGVTVEARSTVLPQPRVTVTDGAGDFRLPGLVPGTY